MNFYEAKAAKMDSIAKTFRADCARHDAKVKADAKAARLETIRAEYVRVKARARKLAEEHPFFAARIRDSWNEFEARLREHERNPAEIVRILEEDVVNEIENYIWERATDNGTW